MAVDPILRPWKALVALGRQRGYVTRAELREVIPVGTWDEQFEEIAVGLHEQGIRIIPDDEAGGADDEAGGAMPAAAGPPPGPLPAPEAPLSDELETRRQTSENLLEGGNPQSSGKSASSDPTFP